MSATRRAIRAAGLAIVRRIGSPVVDRRTGDVVGRALFIPWRGKIHVIGLEKAVAPMFLPQQRLTYWKQEIGFTTHPPPDFESVRQVITSAEQNDSPE
jgi:hypothetical protein